MPKALALTPEFLEFLDLCPSVMLLFEIDSYRIIAANAAAEIKYGCGKEDLAAKTIMDLRPPEEKPRIALLASRLMDGADAAGRSRHIGADGNVFIADVRTQVVLVDGRLCKLAAIHDVTEQVAREDRAQALMAESAIRRRAADSTARHFAELFNLAPSRCAILQPESFEVIAASNRYLETLGRPREAVVGHPPYEYGSGPEADPTADHSEALRASLRRVAETGRDDFMQNARLPLGGAQAPSSDVPASGWDVANIPVKAPDGSVAFILHSLTESTFKTTDSAERATDDHPVSAGREAATLDGANGVDVALLAHENALLADRLGEAEALLRTTSRLLKAHVWRFDLGTQQIEWSDGLFELFGLALDGVAPTFDAYVAMVHPDDRAAMLASHQARSNVGDAQFEFFHRVVRPDGQIIHVKGTGERIVENGRDVLSGVLADVTSEMEAKAAVERQDYLLRIAGEVGRIGGWRVDLSTRIADWSPETARIHESPETRQVGLRRALGFYAPECAELITERFNACATLGAPFDEVLQIITVRGNHVWVRAIGAPERDAKGQIVAVQGAFQDISEGIRLQQEGSALRDRLTRTLENMADAFYTLDSTWRFTYLNPRAESLLRRNRDALLGEVVWTEFPETVGSRFEVEYRRAAESGETVNFEEFYTPLARWFRVTVHPSADGLAVYFRDITRDRARDQQLRLLDAAVARMNDILLITEADPIAPPFGPRIVFVNKAFERLTGYSTDEAIGRTPRFLHGPRTQRDELDRIRAALEKPEAVRTVLINYDRSGREYWLDMDITPLIDASGKLTHFVALQRNMTEQRQAEAHLRLSEERFRVITKATKDVIWDLDLVSGQFWWNDNLLSVLGHDSRALTDRAEVKSALIHPDDVERVTTGFNAAIDGGEGGWQADYRVIHANGSTIHVHDRAVVLHDEAGTAVRVLGSMVDVTRDRETEAILRQSQKLEAIGQLTGGVAHDFNNLLTVIMGNAELLVEKLADREDLRVMAEIAFSAAERGAELTARLLSFASQQALEPKVINLNSTVQSILPLLRHSLGDTVELKVKLGTGLCLAEIDPGQFEAALLNLTINARDAMPSGGKLTIETANTWIDAEAAALVKMDEGQFIVIAVSDTGIGMSPAVVERVLEPFFTTKNKGIGLGLPMAFGFAKQSGGYLKIYSEVGEGTTVKLFFPASSLEGVYSPAEGAAHTTPEGRKEHILVVEDDPLVRQHVIATIKSLGYRISEAVNAAEALELLATEDDIVLMFTDIVMPGGMNGRQLADASLRLRPDLRVLYTSGYTEDAVVHQGRLEPGVQLLSKPYRRRDLALKLRAVLDQLDEGTLGDDNGA